MQQPLSKKLQINQNQMGSDQIEEPKVIDLKETKMDGPTFRALREYFDEWGQKDPTLLRNSQRDVNREGV